ncbi:arylamine N-acetyltransferase family protein [Natronosalvus vescus]|uniref:arylamine N-acetyltransferase family protein n=1 Tax=Natronosalvus vescus TaxID=2953881 RepID=UPI0020914F8D|nr:arylamine N-acetyltransferase [Natronosalvus vescus]
MRPNTTGSGLFSDETTETLPSVMTVRRYLNRIGLDETALEATDLETLTRLQYAHITKVPFENLDIIGDPFSDQDGSGVSLSLLALYEKIVERGRGGYCFELNGLFHWLLAELGYDIDRVGARITSGDSITVPANHHSNIVHLEKDYIVDVGLGTPKLRQPIPLDGSVVSDDLGIEWRVVESDRPDATYRTEFFDEQNNDWTRRYIFDETPRNLLYFEATNDYLQRAPESPFTGSPTVSLGSDRGFLKLSTDTFIEWRNGDKQEHHVPPEQWYDTLKKEFAIQL